MLVSYDWLRSLLPFDETPERVASLLTARGLTLDAMQARGEDTVLEIDVPANRPDCLGHVGVARELAAALRLPFALPESSEAVAPADGAIRVRIDEPALCPRYTATLVRGVRVGPSPDWVVERLEACGLRSLNNVVDVSNLVMLELGQPVHFFDMERLGEPSIVVRTAGAGERLRTLDGERRTLAAGMLVIADAARPVALAGVIGGADTEIREESRDLLIEAAHFEPRQVRLTARRLGLHTDASHRFERGADPEAPLAAQALAVRLLSELAGGAVDGPTVDLYPAPPERPDVALRPQRVERLMGYRPTDEEIEGALRAVQLEPTRDRDALRVRIPSWRVDLAREADLVEEVGRDLGFDRIPAPPATAVVRPPEPALQAVDHTRDLLAHAGFHEAISYAMIGPGDDDPFIEADAPPPAALSNPLAEPLSLLRRSLLPGLLQSGGRNLRRGNHDVRLFELGRVFLPRSPGEAPREPRRAGLFWSGAAAAAHWSHTTEEVDFHGVAGLVEHLLGALGATAWTVRRAARAGLHPGRAGEWLDPDGVRLAVAGALHPEWVERHDLPRVPCLAEIELDPFAAATGEARSRAVPRVPAVSRDLALVVDPGTGWGAIRPVLEAVPAPAEARFAVVDRYEGRPLGPGQASLTVRVTLLPVEETLTDEQTESFRSALRAAVLDVAGVSLRE